MSDEDAFLAAIAATPADDTPRLVYADWLDDRNDPRAEYLRLEVERHRLKPRDKRRPDLAARLEALRPLADPHWLPRIDRTGRYTFYWAPDQCETAREAGRVGRPLDEVHYRNGRTWLPKASAVGDYMYVVAFRRHLLYLVARMRVGRVVANTDRAGYVTALEGVEGAPIVLDRAVPPAVLAGMRWFGSGNEERRPAQNPDGTLASFEQFGRTLRLTLATALDLDALIRAG
jgi:uncharacterized protein (TIGR02996 family)